MNTHALVQPRAIAAVFGHARDFAVHNFHPVVPRMALCTLHVLKQSAFACLERSDVRSRKIDVFSACGRWHLLEVDAEQRSAAEPRAETRAETRAEIRDAARVLNFDT